MEHSEQDHLQAAKLQEEVEALRRQLDQYRLWFVRNPMPKVVFETATLKILDANESAIALYGYSHQQICSMSLLELFPDERREDGDLLVELRRPGNTIGPFLQRGATAQDLVVIMVTSS